MKVAVEGCCHGELDKIYESIQFLEKKDNVKVDLLLCCGDFQAVRNEADMICMAVPVKYRQMQTFYKYYSGEKKAPVLTIFIGGNHEASNHLQELPYGGWVAPNIYYLVNRFLQVFYCSFFSIYFQLKQHMDIFLSHDWPQGIYHYGNKKQLLKKKAFLRPEVESNTLGSPAATELLQHLKPSYWFAAHLHVKFAALMQHPKCDGEQLPKATKFLALDKCLPHRDFLQIVEIEHDPNASEHLEYDSEWLAILKATNDLINVTSKSWNMPENNSLHAKWDYSVSEEDIKELLEEQANNLQIPCNFSQIAPVYDPAHPQRSREPIHVINPQTTEFCATFGLTDLNAKVKQMESEGLMEEEDEMDGADNPEEPSDYTTDTSGLSSSINPDEITLDDDDDDDDNGELSAHSVEPLPDHPFTDSSANFSDVRDLPDSMVVSSDETQDSANEELDKSGDSSMTEGEGRTTRTKAVKRISNEHENGSSGIKLIKRRNQSIYHTQSNENEDIE
ncbi:lariat debranching enzyme [Rhincodon typus]|uniref:lariat debranching enzyme n=1 Tax=Rhincodon typus TaxID=259920 RepID=UPI00202F414F|nr:lariat debranching enzyme [Rhincodon typus]